MYRLLLLLLLWGIVALVAALDEREFDPQVAPPLKMGEKSKEFYIDIYLIYIFFAVSKPFQLWRSFTNQVRLAFSRLQAKPVTAPPPTVKTRMGFTSTTSEPELQFYGALNPIFQTGHF
ncbi:hypothetical protein KR032_006173 [Drosophila birchii]|nr:hypothetical protein KR032_006173 [Drosophila birchii]